MWIVMNFANADMVATPANRAHSQSRRGRGRAARAHLRHASPQGRPVDYHCGSWQRGDDESTGDARAAHLFTQRIPCRFIVVDEARKPLRKGGALQDIAPTLLGLFGISQPKE